MSDSLSVKNRRLLIGLGIVACGMFGFGYALVPLYNVMCKQLSINSQTVSTTVAPLANDTQALMNRSISLQFTTTNNAELAWDFRPNTTQLVLHPGKNYHVSFFAKNNTQHTMTVQAIPSIVPSIAGKYLRKTECFCFRRQTLKAGQSLTMPVIFHIDPEIPNDIKDMTLSYTLFEVKTN
jgi:cytochrome c oxidase assembly protein subunit 11